jgi:hypothetical protein
VHQGAGGVASARSLEGFSAGCRRNCWMPLAHLITSTSSWLSHSVLHLKWHIHVCTLKVGACESEAEQLVSIQNANRTWDFNVSLIAPERKPAARERVDSHSSIWCAAVESRSAANCTFCLALSLCDFTPPLLEHICIRLSSPALCSQQPSAAHD